MKNFILLLFALFFSANFLYSQPVKYPTHFFLGAFSFATDKDTTIEIWDPVDDNEIVGRTIFRYSGGEFLSETLRLVYLDGKLNYCATILEQNPDNPQGEICFSLKSYKDRIFTFENLKHDFPKRIIYDFNNYRFVKARIEGDTSSFDFNFYRDNSDFQSYTLKGKFLKEPFENKVGKINDGVFDYFFQIQGEKYFIKFSGSQIKKDEIENILNKEVKATIFFKDGLWDTNDNTHQSRIGKYINVISIEK